MTSVEGLRNVWGSKIHHNALSTLGRVSRVPESDGEVAAVISAKVEYQWEDEGGEWAGVKEELDKSAVGYRPLK